MIATDILRQEHRVISLVLDAAEREVRSIRGSGQVHVGRVEQMVDFFRGFADRCHHAKEEDLLFVRMAERGLPMQSGPIAAMLAEHEEGRHRVQAIAGALSEAGAGDAQAVRAVAENLMAYVVLLRAHIEKEDEILYPMADQLLTAEDRRALEAAFDRVEAEEMGAGVHEIYHHLAHQLAEG